MTRFETAQAVAVIPARGGSKGVPGKNVAPVGGVPLVARAVRSAAAAGLTAYVSTDDGAIASAARAAGGEVIDRPAGLAGDTASSESALLHSLDALAVAGVHPTALAFLQATSPFIPADALARAVRRVLDDEADSVFSAFETYAFLWRRADGGGAAAVNHDAGHRPRRQEREPHFQETGAFYVLRTEVFRDVGFRFFGRTAFEEVPEATAIEIDSPEQLDLARRLAPALDPAPSAIDADALVMDFDGVHTDDTALVSTDGYEAVRVSRSDGLGIERLRLAGVPMLILSKERHPVVAARAEKLQVPVQHGVDDKATAVAAWCLAAGVDPARTVYVGNDVNDIGALRLVGWPVVVAEAPEEVRAVARVVLTRPGGRGAVREVAELILAGRTKGNE